MALVIAVDDPRVEDVRALLEVHLTFSRGVTPPGHVHALGIDGLLDPAVTFFSAHRGGVLVGIGGLKRLDASRGGVKSLQTSGGAGGEGGGGGRGGGVLEVARGRESA